MHKRIFKSIGIVAVVAATAVPSALATRVIEIGNLTPLGGVSIKAAPKAVDQSDVFTRYVANHTAAGYDGYKSSYPQLHAVGQSGTTVPYLSHGIGVDASQLGGAGTNSTHVQGSQFLTDTLGGNGKAKALSQGYRIVTDTLAPGGATIAAAPAVGGFNWGDAGIGAGGALGLFLLLTLGTTATQRNRKGPLTA
jgi:hypothetical protein